MRPPAPAVPLTPGDRAALERLLRGRNTPQKLVLRAKILLQAADGIGNRQSAQHLGVSRPTVLLWRQRFLGEGLAGLLQDAPRSGRPPRYAAAKVAAIVEATLSTTPKAATHWSARTMAHAQGVGRTTVLRIWHQCRLQPHRIKTFKRSRDPQFLEKLHDVVGLYLNPPAKAVVWSVDEKSQIQALDRTQPLLPMRLGSPAHQTHDYVRHGTTTLFAALKLLDGTVIGECLPRHRHQEFLRFLKRLDRATPPELALHAIVDNYRTHKHARVQRWLKRHPRVQLHFIPTGSSWLNLIERWFREITTKRIRRGTFRSVPELIRAIYEYLAVHNTAPRPFVWTATVEKIMAKLNGQGT